MKKILILIGQTLVGGIFITYTIHGDPSLQGQFDSTSFGTNQQQGDILWDHLVTL